MPQQVELPRLSWKPCLSPSFPLCSLSHAALCLFDLWPQRPINMMFLLPLFPPSLLRLLALLVYLGTHIINHTPVVLTRHVLSGRRPFSRENSLHIWHYRLRALQLACPLHGTKMFSFHLAYVPAITKSPQLLLPSSQNQKGSWRLMQYAARGNLSLHVSNIEG